MGGLAQREVEQHVALGYVEPLGERGDVGRHERGLAGRRRAGAPMSEAREHLAGQARRARSRPAGPSIAPTALPSIAMIGPPMLAASARAARCRGRRPTTRRSARRGPSRRRWCRRSTRRGSRPRSRSRRRGSRWSRRASGRPAGRRRRPRRCCFCDGVGSGCWATVLRAVSMRDVPVQRAVVGLHHRLELAEELAEVGRCRRAKNCSNGVPRNGFWSSSGGGCVGHGSTVRRRRSEASHPEADERWPRVGHVPDSPRSRRRPSRRPPRDTARRRRGRGRARRRGRRAG